MQTLLRLFDETEPTTAAADPTIDEANVISLFSDAYTNLEGTDYPDWGQTTVLSNVPIEGNETIQFLLMVGQVLIFR